MPSICHCEIRDRWTATSQVRIDMMLQLERRGIVTSDIVNQHGTTERVWRNTR